MRCCCLPVLLGTLAVQLVVGGRAVDPREHLVTGRRVRVMPHQANWYKASESCRRLGMQLLTVKTPRENLEVAALGKHHQLEWVWSAATDLASRGVWVWSTDGQLVQDTFWRDGEPSGGEERCLEVQMQGFPSHWNDNDCKSLRPFLCEEVPQAQAAHGRTPLTLAQIEAD